MNHLKSTFLHVNIGGPSTNKLTQNLCGLEPQLIKLEFIIYLPKLKVSRAFGPWAPYWGQLLLL